MNSVEWDFLKKIDGKKSVWRLIPAELRGLAKKLEKGELMTGEELAQLKDTWIKKTPYIDSNGKPFVLFILDRSFNVRWRTRFLKPFSRNEVHKSEYKYHFMHCSTQEKMVRIGKDTRYKAKYDIENPLFPSVESDLRRDILDVCKNCLSGYDFNKWHNPPPPSVEEFNLKDFFDSCNGVYPQIRCPSHQHYNMKYTNDWQKISREYKEGRGWRCEECSKKCSNNKGILHCHHINGVKDDNKPSNLKALCRSCHGKEPQHGHLKNKTW